MRPPRGMTTTTMNRGAIRLAGTYVVIDGGDCAQKLVRRQGGTAWKFHTPFSFTNAISKRELLDECPLQPGRRRLDRRLAREHAFRLQFPFVNLVAAGGVKFVKVRTSEADICQPRLLRLGDDSVDASGLIAKLHAQ